MNILFFIRAKYERASNHLEASLASAMRGSFLTLATMLVGMIAFETAKESIAPGLTKWQSHGITIVFSSAVALVASSMTQRRYWLLYQRYDRMSTNAPGMVYQFRVGADGAPSFDFVSEGCREFFGLSPKQICQNPMSLIAMIHADDRAEFDRSVSESQQTLCVWSWEGRFCVLSGEEKWMRGQSRPERQPDGSTLWDGVLVNVTNRKQAQLALQKAHEELETRIVERTDELTEARDFLRRVIDATPSFISVKNKEGRFTLVNQALAEIHGMTVEELTGRLETEINPNAQELSRFHADDRIVMTQLRERFIPEEYMTDAQGQVHWLQTVKRPLVSADGTRRHVMAVSTEITEHKTAKAEIWRLNAELELNLAEVHTAYDATIEAWAHFLDLRDKETEGHSRRVTEMTLRLAEALGLGDLDLVQVRRGALLHDIGKMGIPDAILLKPGSLNEEEWDIMRRHPIYAHDLLTPITFLTSAVDIPYCHHERWDGAGYPRGLSGTEIPIAARLFAVVDVWDALRSDRPYRKAWPAHRVLEHIRDLSGSHFDPQAVDAFLDLIAPQLESQDALAA